MRLLLNYFMTLGEGPVRERMPVASIDPLTSQSTAFEHYHLATESGLISLSLSVDVVQLTPVRCYR